jgi:hypothetical protein
VWNRAQVALPNKANIGISALEGCDAPKLLDESEKASEKKPGGNDAVRLFMHSK